MEYQGIILLVIQLVVYQHNVGANIIDRLRLAKYRPANNSLVKEIILRPEKGLNGGIVKKEKPKVIIPAGVENDQPETQVCADIVFANDASCSLDNKVQADQVDLIVAIASSLDILDEEGARIGAFSYGQYVDTTTKVEFLPGESNATMRAKLNNIARNLKRCRTIPYRAMHEAIKYFKGENDRNDEMYKDVLIFVGDGWTSPIRTRKQNAIESRKLRRANVDILWIKTKAKNGLDEIKTVKNNGTAFDVEILPIVKDAEKIFNYTTDSTDVVVKDVIRYLVTRYFCKEVQ